MSFAGKKLFHDTLQVADKVDVSVIASKSLAVYERVVHAAVNTASGNIAITLPNVSEAGGLSYTFYATIANLKTITIQDNNESVGWADVVLTVTGDRLYLVSDGISWFKLLEIST